MEEIVDCAWFTDSVQDHSPQRLTSLLSVTLPAPLVTLSGVTAFLIPPQTPLAHRAHRENMSRSGLVGCAKFFICIFEREQGAAHLPTDLPSNRTTATPELLQPRPPGQGQRRRC